MNRMIRSSLAVVALATLVTTATTWILPESPMAEAEARESKSHAVEPAIPGIVFVAAPMFDETVDVSDQGYLGSYHWRDGYVYARSTTYHRGERTMGPMRPGKNLYSLIPASPEGELRQLTFLKTGAVFKPEPSYDGKTILFSMRRDGEDWFHLYEMRIDGTGLRQLTDGPFNDFAGVYLPDGRIVFVSDRTGFLEEYHEERTECLFVMNGDGTGIHQITFAPGTYFEPSVMRDGRILFAFWDAFHIDVPPLDKHETFLMTVQPDGTGERHLFGVGQYRFFNRERHSGVGLTQAYEMPDGRILCQSEFGPTLIDPGFGTDPRDALWPIFPGMTSVQLGGTTHRAHLSPLGTRSTARPLPDGRILFSATEPGARDRGIYVVDPDTRTTQLVYNIPDYAEFDAVPVLVSKPRPRVVPKATPCPERYSGGDPTRTARFLVVAGRGTDHLKRAEALEKARYLRVIEAEYTGVTTSSHTNLECRILGHVPMYPDGSAYFEAPADTPLFLEAIDANGRRILHVWSFPNTSVPPDSVYPVTQMAYMVGRAGETKSCYGCHAPQTTAVPNVPLEALKHPPTRITRESTDLQYRRNDPRDYRRQAMIGEENRYRRWLDRGNREQKRRACEMLMYLDDTDKATRSLLVELLQDSSVELRRAASLALVRLGTPSEKQALQRRAAEDADALVQFHARTAVEGIEYRSQQNRRLKQILDQTGQEGEELRRRLATDPRRGGLPPLESVELIRAAGRVGDPRAIPLLASWLKRHEWEYHAAEAAIALGRIGTPKAVQALWAAVRSEVPNKRVVYARYLQHGPRPEEYALLEGLIRADSKPALDDVHLLIALLPNTFMEKPRFEDRMRTESQRVRMPRLLLEKAGFRRSIVRWLLGDPVDPALGEQVVKGINLERPFKEHGRPFPVIRRIGAEEKLWLLTCLANPGEVPKDFAIPFLTADNPRLRVDAAVLLGLQGFSEKGAKALASQVATPYDFPEISSIGKGMPDPRFRDKAYMVQALAMHVDDVSRLRQFADPRAMYRDIRYGLTRGLARRGKADAIPLLVEMATNDPLTLIRQQARYAVADIQDAIRLRGENVPTVEWPEPKPMESLYQPQPWSWQDTTPDRLPRPANSRDLATLLSPKNFRNLNVAQARGAERIMIHHVADFRRFAAGLNQADAETMQVLKRMLDSPYPYANYLAAKKLGELGDRRAVPLLITKLKAWSKGGNPVGFWWCCEALAALKAKEAMPILARMAVPANPPATYGPIGMPTGYIAARSLARIVGTIDHPDVARLLASDNIWLRSGALRGLAEADAPGITPLLERATRNDQPALVRSEARIQLQRRRQVARVGRSIGTGSSP